MTDKITTLKDLLAKVEAGVWYIRYDRHAPFDWAPSEQMYASQAYDGSFDAFSNLIEAVLPDWEWNKSYDGDIAVRKETGAQYFRRFYHQYETGTNSIAARAGLIAVIKALIWEETQ
jgi:hypothetical protein